MDAGLQELLEQVAERAARKAISQAKDAPITREWMSAEDVYKYTGIDAQTLEYWRKTGRGPLWFRVGYKFVRYRKADIDAYFGSRPEEERG